MEGSLFEILIGIVAFSCLLLLAIYGIILLIEIVIFVLSGKDYSIGKLIHYLITTIYYKRREKEFDQILRNKIGYYRNLNDESRSKFLFRVCDFILSKNFTPCQITEVSMEQKVLISAAAIQLTFGLDNYLLMHFSEILVYPRSYYSSFGKEYHEGEVNLGGAIILSYEDVLKGYSDAQDGINLGLHEMAHSLKFSEIIDDDTKDYFLSYYQKWQAEAEGELKKMNQQGNSFLRGYATANIDEFFAVCAEAFFERPEQFNNHSPELFKRMILLLNQDPLHPDQVKPDPMPKELLKGCEPVEPVNLEYVSKEPFRRKVYIFSFHVLIILPILTFPDLWVKVIAALLLLVSFIITMTRNKRIYLYENGMVIKPGIGFGQKHTLCDYKKIALIDFVKIPKEDVNEPYDFLKINLFDFRGINKWRIIVKHCAGQMLKVDKYKVSLDEESVDELKKRLAFRNVKVNQ